MGKRTKKIENMRKEKKSPPRVFERLVSANIEKDGEAFQTKIKAI